MHWLRCSFEMQNDSDPFKQRMSLPEILKLKCLLETEALYRSGTSNMLLSSRRSEETDCRSPVFLLHYHKS